MRNIYSPDVRCASELVVDQLARAMGKDPLRVPAASSCKDERVKAVLGKVAEVGELGTDDAARHRPGHRASTRSTRAPPPAWWRSTAGPETVNRKIRDGVTGPRVTKAVFAVDAGLVVNPHRPRRPR